MTYRIKSELIFIYSCLSLPCPQETSPISSLIICYMKWSLNINFYLPLSFASPLSLSTPSISLSSLLSFPLSPPPASFQSILIGHLCSLMDSVLATAAKIQSAVQLPALWDRGTATAVEYLQGRMNHPALLEDVSELLREMVTCTLSSKGSPSRQSQGICCWQR